jgi:hypothetical protein
MLKKFEQQLLEPNWQAVQPGVDVKFCRAPEGTDDIFVLCRSQGRKEKENAILSRFETRLETKLNDLAHQAQISKVRDKQKVERRIGRLLERNSRAASLFNVTVTESGTGKDLRSPRGVGRYLQLQVDPASTATGKRLGATIVDYSSIRNLQVCP